MIFGAGIFLVRNSFLVVCGEGRGRPFRIEEKAFDADATPKAVEIFNQATWHRVAGPPSPE
jgi:hypothetical protein